MCLLCADTETASLKTWLFPLCQNCTAVLQTRAEPKVKNWSYQPSIDPIRYRINFDTIDILINLPTTTTQHQASSCCVPAKIARLIVGIKCTTLCFVTSIENGGQQQKIGKQILKNIIRCQKAGMRQWPRCPVRHGKVAKDKVMIKHWLATSTSRPYEHRKSDLIMVTVMEINWLRWSKAMTT